MAQNPYATPAANPGRAPVAAHGFWNGPGRYAVRGTPDTTDPEYTLGFSPELKAGGSPDGSMLPDDIRTGHREANVGENYNEPKWVARRTSEQNKRYSEDHTDTMWKTQQRRVPAPRMPIWEQDRPPHRPTAENSPSGYAFQRPWHIPRNAALVFGENTTAADGASRMHFSMADHRRKYEIGLQTPRGKLGVNTYRASPRPWDENLFIPPPAGQAPSGIAGNRAYRL